MKRYQPALLGGLFIGVLSSLPVVKIANCCCLWVITGGLLTVYLQQQSQAEPVQTGDGVLGGLVAGLVGGLVAVLIGYVEFVALGSVFNMADQVRQALDQNPQMPADIRDMIVNLVSGKGVALLALIQLPVYAVFGMLGALLGLALFRKKQPPVVQG
jgi:amino acid transporter